MTTTPDGDGTGATPSPVTTHPGDDDVRRAVAAIGRRLPEPLRPLARAAYDFSWAWCGGEEVFASVDPRRWAACGRNPVRLLLEAQDEALEAAASDPSVRARIEELATRMAHPPPARTDLPRGVDPTRPVAFVCAEFGVHESLPLYAGGLGVLAGDILKTASDRGLPMVGLGLLYRYGYLHQRLDLSGWQTEYWAYLDPTRRPLVQLTHEGRPLTVRVPLWDGELALHVWRANVGRVPLYLLDSDHPDNDAVGRWVTARLYEASRDLRFAQYVTLGCGAVRLLDALGVTPAVIHLNEGHAALAGLELAAASTGASHTERLAEAARKVVFTTHTPVAAGNEEYSTDEFRATAGGLAERLGIPVDDLVDLGRVHRGQAGAPMGLTPLALRTSRHANAVSARHGTVAREMWRPAFPGSEGPPIAHVTNGVHVPTWVSGPMRALLDRHLGPQWLLHAGDARVWAAVEGITDEELWDVRSTLRRTLVDYVRARVANDRLRRGETLAVVRGTVAAFDPERLTVGFARRLATYKRLHLLTLHTERLASLLGDDRGIQVVVAGKAHPSDDGGKRAMQELFTFRRDHALFGRIAVIENHDLAVSRALVAGCDVWLNTPRPPMEASGTSGMKAAVNGALQVSVLDGWWAEAYRPEIGWAIGTDDGHGHGDEGERDQRDAAALTAVLGGDVVPQFYDRDGTGIPRSWTARIRRALRALGPFVAGERMLAGYERDIYPS